MNRALRAAFRADASLDMGTGHVMRCLTLAEEIRRRGGSAIFLCREHPGNLIKHIESRNFAVVPLPMADTASSPVSGLAHASWLGASQADDAAACKAALLGTGLDLLVVDHYGLDAHWEAAMGDMARRIMAIDDIADRHHDCDILLDQNLGRQDIHYQNLVPSRCRVLTGTRYALLRPEFAQWRDFSLKRREKLHEIRSLLVNLGGVDKSNLTAVVLAALGNCALPLECKITVVMGGSSPGLLDVKSRAACMARKTEVLINVDNMAEIMAHADLAIGAAGTTSWERCCLGLPAIVMVLADNQRLLAENLARTGAAKMIEEQEDIAPQLQQHILEIMQANNLMSMSQMAATVTDGQGTARVLQSLAESGFDLI